MNKLDYYVKGNKSDANICPYEKSVSICWYF